MTNPFRSDKRRIHTWKRVLVLLLKDFGVKGTSISKITGVPVSTV